MNQSTKRTDYISWDEYFMGIALLSAQRSKDPSKQVGACIVNEDNKIVGVGYNGFPIGCHDNVLTWGKNKEDPLNDKNMYVCHAEMNAIVNRYSADLKNTRIYTTLFPCNECAKIIIQSGIKSVIYLEDKADDARFKGARKMFELVGIKPKCYKVGTKEILLNFVTSYLT